MRRHPIRGLVGGLLLGIGLALALVQLAVVPLGEATVVVVLIACVILGVAAAWLLPARRAPLAARQPMVEPISPPPPLSPPPPADPDAPTESWRRPEDPDRQP